ncbi:MAG: isocitrate/isopropylmalate dehydrogenase family protein, partial [Firmicutes bacterium]|nr:isocitrate/isopropylmalate dehydrogenase family protein [Bacillota bacterium]
NLIKEPQNSRFNVFVLPNLYGDIITDEAAQIQGGVGTAGSVNMGSRYAMFEAIHGSAPRMIKEGRGAYANPSSIVKAAEMMLRHIGRIEKADILNNALDKATASLNMTSDEKGNTTDDFTAAVISNL